jgi:glycosyltransferase involved in cell wall biosynthesis
MQERPRRILEVLEATAGGTREHILQILRGMDAARFQLSLLCSAERDPGFAQDIEELRRAGIAVFVVPMRREIRPLADLTALVRIVKHLRRHRYDIVHTHSSKAGFLGRVAAWLCGVRRIYHTPHVYYFQWRPRSLAGRFYRFLEWLAGRLTTRVVAVSESQRRIAVRCGVVRPDRIVVIKNGVDASLFQDASARNSKRRELGVGPGELLVGMAGRLEPQKGCEHFIRAAKIVTEQLPRVRFVLAGSGHAERRLRALAKELRLDGALTFLGHRADLPQLYQAMDLFALSSLWEGMPYVILEAMASGLAVVATDVPGTRDIVRQGETGFLVPPENEQAIAGRVLTLLRAPRLREEMGNRGRAYVRRFHTRARFLGELTRLYEQ